MNGTTEGFIYVAGDTASPQTHFKVGLSANPRKRLNNLNTSSPGRSIVFLDVWWVTNMRAAERAVHSRLVEEGLEKDHEWFRMKEGLFDHRDLIEKVLKKFDGGHGYAWNVAVVEEEMGWVEADA